MAVRPFLTRNLSLVASMLSAEFAFAQAPANVIAHLDAARKAMLSVSVRGLIRTVSDRQAPTTDLWDYSKGRERYIAGTEHDRRDVYRTIWDGYQTIGFEPQWSNQPNGLGRQPRPILYGPIWAGYTAWDLANPDRAALNGPIWAAYTDFNAANRSRIPWLADVARRPGVSAKVMPNGRIRLSIQSSFRQGTRFIEVNPAWGYMADEDHDVQTAAGPALFNDVRVTHAKKIGGCWVPTVIVTYGGNPRDPMHSIRHLINIRADVSEDAFVIPGPPAGPPFGLDWRSIGVALPPVSGLTGPVPAGNGRLPAIPPVRPSSKLTRIALGAAAFVLLLSACFVAVRRRALAKQEGYWGPDR